MLLVFDAMQLANSVRSVRPSTHNIVFFSFISNNTGLLLWFLKKYTPKCARIACTYGARDMIQSAAKIHQH